MLCSSSENNIELFEDYDHEEEDETPRPGIEPYVSDHEFSPESDINEDDDEYLPEKRARTAHKKGYYHYCYYYSLYIFDKKCSSIL